MGIEVDITEIKKMVEDHNLFRPASDDEVNNRPKSPSGLVIGQTVTELPTAEYLDLMTEWESVGLGDEDLIKAFSYLIYKGMAWRLQGAYGRQARTLITDGWLGEDGRILKLPSIRPRVQEAGLFKPASDDVVKNRPARVMPYKRITSVDQLRELAKHGVEVFISGGAPLWEQHSFMYVSHATDGTDEWMVDDYNSGKMYQNPRNSGLIMAMSTGVLWYDRAEFVNNFFPVNGSVPTPESITEAIPKKAPKGLFQPATPDAKVNREEVQKFDAAVSAKQRAAGFAGLPSEDLSWEEVARRELSIELDVDIRIDDNQYGDGVSMTAVYGKGNNDESGWVVYETSDDAERVALKAVESDLENDPEMFGESFLESHLRMSDTDRRLTAQEEADNTVDNIWDETELLEYSGLDTDYQEIQDQIDALDSDAPDYDAQFEALEARKEEILTTAEETAREKKYDEIYGQLGDPVQYFVHETGMYSLIDLLKASFMHIDTEAAARDAVNSDGVANYLDRYDGSEVELPSGAVAFGTN